VEQEEGDAALTRHLLYARAKQPQLRLAA
jgi:hypothetical protein